MSLLLIPMSLMNVERGECCDMTIERSEDVVLLTMKNVSKCPSMKFSFDGNSLSIGNTNEIVKDSFWDHINYRKIGYIVLAGAGIAGSYYLYKYFKNDKAESRVLEHGDVLYIPPKYNISNKLQLSESDTFSCVSEDNDFVPDDVRVIQQSHDTPLLLGTKQDGTREMRELVDNLTNEVSIVKKDLSEHDNDIRILREDVDKNRNNLKEVANTINVEVIREINRVSANQEKISRMMRSNVNSEKGNRMTIGLPPGRNMD